MLIEIELDGQPFTVRIKKTPDGTTLTVDDDTWNATIRRTGAKSFAITLDDTTHHVDVPDDETILIDDQLLSMRVARFDPVGDETQGAGTDGVVRPPMPGNIAHILIKQGDTVAKGAPMVVLEAMKMQNEILAPYNATIRKIHVNQGDTVTLKDVVLELDQTEQ